MWTASLLATQYSLPDIHAKSTPHHDITRARDGFNPPSRLSHPIPIPVMARLQGFAIPPSQNTRPFGARPLPLPANPSRHRFPDVMTATFPGHGHAPPR